MKWQGRQGSDNVEDQRGGGGGGFGGMKLGGVGLVIVLIVSLLTGQNPMTLLQTVNQAMPEQTAEGQAPQGPQPDDPAAEFVGVVLKDTEDVWDKVFAEKGMTYQRPKLVLFRSSVSSACGNASAAMGPFYCPVDSKVYIDLSFYDELKEKFGAPGDFAMAYVVAHEVGHHVQNLLGTSGKMDAARSRMSKTEYNALSVRLELQADYFAGLWANRADKEKHILEAGDIDEALTAANAIGDDKLQKEGQGYIVPDAFTHGTSAQRKRWFRAGFDNGTLEAGNTFEAESL